jgi:hypothetical protein
MVAVAAGWQKSGKTRRPRQTSDARLAKDIVSSIKAHQEVGVSRSAQDYSSRIEIIEAVEELLGR